MNSCGHKIVKCKDCGKVISQCRCMMVDKPIELVLCDDCKGNTLKEIFNSFTDTVYIREVYSDETQEALTKRCEEGMIDIYEGRQGVTIGWSKKGMGFGSISIIQENGKLRIDTENMSKEFVIDILTALVNNSEIH